VSEGFRPEGLTLAYDVVLGNHHHGLLLNTPRAIDDFTARYSIDSVRYVDIARGLFIDWARVASDYSVILCTPYIWERRWDPFWYFLWDCASGCIFDPAAIESITLRQSP
jgi:hypothetical protein